MKKGFLWNVLNSPAAAIISSLITMTTKLVPDIKPDNGGETPSVYLFSQLMTLEVAFLSPYVSGSLCHTLVAHSKAPGVHARRDGDLHIRLCKNWLLFQESAAAPSHLSWPVPSS